jgi:putative ABC transport system permease protein
MSMSRIAFRNAWRNRVRAVLTVLGVAVAIIAFMMLRTVLSAWTAAADHAAKDRIATRHKVTFIMPLPIRYVEEIRQTPGVSGVTYMDWFGAKNPNAEDSFFASIAVDAPSFLEVYDEIELPADQREHWLGNRRGAIIGDALAKQFGWKVGDRITLSGTIYPGDWEFSIDGIYTSKRKTIDRSTLWFHWGYLNETKIERIKDTVGWIPARVDDPAQAASIARRIDEKFAERDVQTLSMSERAMNTSFLGMLSAILKAIDVVSLVILLIMTLILGNTIAMGVRERTHEYGVLRALGFLPRHLAVFIVAESIVIGVVGGALGIVVAIPLINQGVGRFLEENMGGFFPYFRVELDVMVAAQVLAVLLAAAAAVIPAYRAYKLNVTDALKRIG